MADNFFNKMEREDERIFRLFNEDRKLFKTITYHRNGTRLDAICIEQNDSKCHVEIKQRLDKYGVFNDFAKQYGSIFLDTGKLEEFSKKLESGFTLGEDELFVSIFDGGNTIILHNIEKKQPVSNEGAVELRNKGTRNTDHELRFGYYWWTGTIYTKNENGNYRKWTETEKRDYMMENKIKDIHLFDLYKKDNKGNYILKPFKF